MNTVEIILIAPLAVSFVALGSMVVVGLLAYLFKYHLKLIIGAMAIAATIGALKYILRIL